MVRFHDLKKYDEAFRTVNAEHCFTKNASESTYATV